jgi:putative transport protein
MLGISLGLALGLISIPLFGSGHFALGTAGGPLVVGLVVGHLERTGPIVWQPPYGANLAIRQLGTILFLGTVGSRSGGALVDALSTVQGAKLAVAGLAVIAIAAGCTVGFGRRFVGLGGARVAGALAAMETQPAVLAFANEQTADERVGTTYALVFPVAMLLKILLAQLLALL